MISRWIFSLVAQCPCGPQNQTRFLLRTIVGLSAKLFSDSLARQFQGPPAEPQRLPLHGSLEGWRDRSAYLCNAAATTAAAPVASPPPPPPPRRQQQQHYQHRSAAPAAPLGLAPLPPRQPPFGAARGARIAAVPVSSAVDQRPRGTCTAVTALVHVDGRGIIRPSLLPLSHKPGGHQAVSCRSARLQKGDSYATSNAPGSFCPAACHAPTQGPATFLFWQVLDLL